jgi:hypothetical protein
MTADEHARYDEMVALVTWLRDRLGEERMYRHQLEGGCNDCLSVAAHDDLVTVETTTTRIYRRDEVDEAGLVATVAHRLSSQGRKPAPERTR